MKPTENRKQVDGINEKFKKKTGKTFDEIYIEFKPKLERFVVRKLGRYTDPHDHIADLFIFLVDKIDQYDSTKGVFSTWVFTLARNQMVSKLRSKHLFMGPNTVMLYPTDEMSNGISGNYENADHYENINDEWRTIKQKANIVLECMDGLNENQRMCLTYRYVDGLPYKAIAEKMDVGINTIKTWIHSGRQVLSNKVIPEFIALEESEYQ